MSDAVQYEKRVQVEGVRSRASIGGHPLHPIVVVFPIAFLTAALLTDIVFAITGVPFWATASVWLIGAGLVMGVLAALLGLIDFVTIERVRSLTAGWAHFLVNGAVLVIALINLLIRIGRPMDAVLPIGIVLSAGMALGLLVSGYFGGELVYRHKVGVVPHTTANTAE